MDVEHLVWGAYLEVLSSFGARMTAVERQALRDHRRAVQAAARRAVIAAGDQEDHWTQLDLFTD